MHYTGKQISYRVLAGIRLETMKFFSKENCKLLQDATKQELEFSLLGRKKQNGLNDPKCSHWKPTNQPTNQLTNQQTNQPTNQPKNTETHIDSSSLSRHRGQLR
jgi:hypothetical protein